MNKKVKNSYVLILDFAGDIDSVITVIGVYSTLEKAKKAFKEQLKSEKEFGIEYDHIEEDTETKYLAYMDGEYCYNHLNLRIIKKELM